MFAYVKAFKNVIDRSSCDRLRYVATLVWKPTTGRDGAREERGCWGGMPPSVSPLPPSLSPRQSS